MEEKPLDGLEELWHSPENLLLVSDTDLVQHQVEKHKHSRVSPGDKLVASCFLFRSKMLYRCWVTEWTSKSVLPLVRASSEGTYPDPAGSKLKQLCMKGTLHKSYVTLQRWRSSHRDAVITGDRWVPLFFPPWGTSAGPWSVSISAFLSRKCGPIHGEDDTRSPGGSSRQTHGVAVASLGRHANELRNGRGGMPVLGGPTSLCVYLCEINNGQGSHKVRSLFFLHTPFASHSYTLVVTESPAWVWWWHPRKLRHQCTPIPCINYVYMSLTIHCTKGTATEVAHSSQHCSCIICTQGVPPGLWCSTRCCQQIRPSSSLSHHGATTISGRTPVHTSCKFSLMF